MAYDEASIERLAAWVQRGLDEVKDCVDDLYEWESGYIAALRRVDEWLTSSSGPSET